MFQIEFLFDNITYFYFCREFVLQGRTTETEYTREEDGVVVKRSKLIMLAAKVTVADLDFMPPLKTKMNSTILAIFYLFFVMVSIRNLAFIFCHGLN